ncbi:MAG: hypothetical protein ABR552_08800 [Actinomycetota bacterium]
MSFEDDIKQAFARHAGDASPTEDAWPRVESTIGASHVRRAVATSSLALAVIAVAVAVPLALARGGTNPGGFANPLPPPSTSPTAPSGPFAEPGWSVAAADGFAVQLPPGWKSGWWEGTWEYEPTGSPSLAQGGDTFAVTVTLRGNRDELPKQSGTISSIDGVVASRIEEPRRVFVVAEWPGHCHVTDENCTTEFRSQIMIVTLRADTNALWAKYSALGESILRSIKHYDGSTPLHGSLDPMVPADDLTKAVVRFMDARVEGVGAEGLLCCDATGFYTTDRLYQPNGHSLLGYQIHPGTDESAGRTYVVTVMFDTNGEFELSGMSETITVGHLAGQGASGSAPLVIDGKLAS